MNLRAKWDRASRTYDLATLAEDLRQGPAKRALYARARGRTLLVALGTGKDLHHLPPDLEVVGIDISPEMVRRSQQRAAARMGSTSLHVADVQALPFPSGSFDTVVTACTFCSVPEPVRGLLEVKRVLTDNGRLLMFEHVRSELPAIGTFLDVMTVATRHWGPDMNRDTIGNVRRAGFEIRSVENVYLDIVKAIEARPRRQDPA